MADKTWSEMTTDEKLESLNIDRQGIIHTINVLGTEIANLRRQVVPKLNEVAEAVEQLEARMRALDGK